MMTNREYNILRERLGLPVIGMAPVLGISTRQAQRYAMGDTIPGPVAKLLRIMVDREIAPAEVEGLT